MTANRCSNQNAPYDRSHARDNCTWMLLQHHSNRNVGRREEVRQSLGNDNQMRHRGFDNKKVNL